MAGRGMGGSQEVDARIAATSEDTASRLNSAQPGRSGSLSRLCRDGGRYAGKAVRRASGGGVDSAEEGVADVLGCVR